MPFYEIIEEPVGHWQDDDEPMDPSPWDDGMAELYLRAEEAWPLGATIREAFHAGDRPFFPREEPGDFDD
ncbi:MAG: hypothetical protein H6935_01110 [Thiobacillus sp.]|nr:hypothetical protein [Thiobacillus sp.]